MAYILSIDTSDKICSVALSSGYELIGSLELTDNRSHAAGLTVIIEKLLKQKEFDINKLNALCISMGPGSYTGLRIGVSVAKGINYALNIPLLAINTLEILTIGLLLSGELRNFNFENSDFLLCPMIDARRMEVYCGFYNSKAELTNEISAKIIDENSFTDVLKNKKIVFFGGGSEKCREVIQNPNAIFIDNFNPHASYMVSRATDLYNNKKFENLAYFEPFYLKDFVATISKKSVFSS